MAYTLEHEEKWKQEISQAAREQGPNAPSVIERSGKEYEEYFFEYFKKYITKDNSNTFLLDIGCGTGKIAKKLVNMGFQVYGVDFSQDIISLAKQYAPQAHFQTSSAYALPFSARMFDIVICLGLFQTVADITKALQEILRVLKPGGVVIIRVTNSLSVGSLFLEPSINFFHPYKFKVLLDRFSLHPIALKGVYVFPSLFHWIGSVLLKTKLFKVYNLFFPLFCFFSHSFYMEAKKISIKQ